MKTSQTHSGTTPKKGTPGEVQQLFDITHFKITTVFTAFTVTKKLR